MSDRASGAPPVRGLSLDPRALEENLTGWLRRRFGDPRLTIASLTVPESAGVNNETVLLSVCSEAPELQARPGLVVRLEPLNTQFPDVTIALQHRLYAAMERHPEIPTPRVFGLEEDAGVAGRRFFVMERLEGLIPSDNPPYQQSGWFAELPASDRGELWRNAVRTMARLHMVSVAEVAFLRDYGIGGVREQLGVARRGFDRGRRGREFPLLERAWEWLQANAPYDAAEGFSWGDARCANMMFTGTRCTGLLDWDMTSLCGAESDLAWWLIFDLTSNGGGASLPGMLSPAQTIRLWEETTGREARNLEYWIMFHLFWLGGIMIRLIDFLAENGTPAPGLAGRDEVNTAMSVLHSRFGTGVDQGLGSWDFFRPVLK